MRGTKYNKIMLCGLFLNQCTVQGPLCSLASRAQKEKCIYFLKTLKMKLHTLRFIDVFSYHFWFCMSVLYLKILICSWSEYSSNIDLN